MAERKKRQIGALTNPPFSIEGRGDQTGDDEATRQEEREASENAPGPAHGRRGDLGDAGPGED